MTTHFGQFLGSSWLHKINSLTSHFGHFRGNHDHIKITHFLVILVNLWVIMTSHYCVQQVPTCAWLDFWHNGHAAGKVGMQSKWQGQFFNAPFISSNNHDSSKYMKCGLVETSLFTPLTLQPFYILGSGNLTLCISTTACITRVCDCFWLVQI